MSSAKQPTVGERVSYKLAHLHLRGILAALGQERILGKEPKVWHAIRLGAAGLAVCTIGIRVHRCLQCRPVLSVSCCTQQQDSPQNIQGTSGSKEATTARLCIVYMHMRNWIGCYTRAFDASPILFCRMCHASCGTGHAWLCAMWLKILSPAEAPHAVKSQQAVCLRFWMADACTSLTLQMSITRGATADLQPIDQRLAARAL